MMLLHTSDWHLGRSFHGTGLLEAQREVLAALTATVVERGVDVVLLAGDVYDRALPPADAVRLLDEALTALRAAGAQVVLTSGNHDSAVRLGFGGALMEASGVHVRADAADLDRPVLLTEPGEDGGPGQTVAVYGVPFLEPRHQGQVWEVEPHHTGVMQEAVRRVRADLEARRAAPGAGPVVGVLLAHLFAAGGRGSESERDIGEGEHPQDTAEDAPVEGETEGEAEGEAPAAAEGAPAEAVDVVPEALLGTLGQVPIGVFDGLDYVALGHLHGRQRLAEHVRYSGSPLPYSFSEAGHRKGGWLVRVADGAVAEVEAVDWEAGRQLAVLRGELTELLESAAFAWAQERWVQVAITDEERPERALERLKSRFPHVLVFRHEPAGGRRTRERTYADALRQAPNDLALSVGFVEHVRERAASGPEQDLLKDALAASRGAEVRA